MTAFSLSAFGSVVKGMDGSFKGDCETTNDILGPFYRPGAPVRSDLLFDGLSGTRIEIRGKLFHSDCTTPVSNALVEIWHCDTEGEYDNDSSEFRHRAALQSNADGSYFFRTILPGKYLNGELYRPSHIHYRVTSKNTLELISQIYFSGDPDIAKDHWASQPKAKERILAIAPADTHGNLTIFFDIYLEK